MNGGQDSLHALAIGLASFRFKAEIQGLKDLSWDDLEGQTGLPLVINELDEDFQTLILAQVNAELARRRMWQKALRRGDSR